MVNISGLANAAAIRIQNGQITWDKSDSSSICLRNLNLDVQPGKLIAVVGRVGSGKTSFISALLGEMERISGSVSLAGSVAYVAQQPWMQNQTIRNNILFGKRYYEAVYQQVLDACCLYPDLEMFAMGDMTEIGERVGSSLIMCCVSG